MAISTVSQEQPVNVKAVQSALTYPEALKLSHFGKLNYLLIFVTGLVLCNTVLETASMGFILPIAQCELHMSNQDKGILSTIPFVGIIISGHLWGFLADTLGRRKIMAPTLITGFLVTVISSFSHTFWIMGLLRFLNGFFISGGAATIYAYLGEFHTDKTRSRAMMGSSVIFAIGAMALPALAYMVINQDWMLPLSFLGIDYKPWRLFMIVCGVPGLICGILLYILPESPKFLLSRGREEEAIEALKKMHRWNGGSDADYKLSHIVLEEDAISADIAKRETHTNSNFAAVFLQTMWHQTAPLFKRKYLRTTVIVCHVQFCLYSVTSGLYLWFPHILNSVVEFMNEHPGDQKDICHIVYEKHMTLYKTDGSVECITKLENTTFYYTVMKDVFYVFSFTFIGLIINRLGKIPILFVSIITFTSCGLSSIFIADLNIAVYMYLAFFLVGVAINVLGATTVELYPTHLRGMAICISMMIGRSGAVFGSNITGALLSHYCEWTFYISAGFLFFSAFLILCLPRKQPEEFKKGNVET